MNEQVKERKFDLQERLIDFSLHIIRLSNQLPDTKTGQYLANQIVRSGISPALNYGEAQAAESKNDFIHKMGICLKELRETSVSIEIIKRGEMIRDVVFLEKVAKESAELVAIFSKSISTAKLNRIKK